MAVCFVGLAGLSICQRGFVQCARSDCWIVVKQRDSFKCFAGVIEISVPNSEPFRELGLEFRAAIFTARFLISMAAFVRPVF
jgi:hypothetical protein